jgi:hypothetical protein
MFNLNCIVIIVHVDMTEDMFCKSFHTSVIEF